MANMKINEKVKSYGVAMNFFKHPMGKAVIFMGVFTVFMLSHRWYIRPYFKRQKLLASEEMAEVLYNKGQEPSRAEQRF